MKARVKETCQWKTVTAFAGREYVKSEWRVVPDSARGQAARHPFLDIQVAEKTPTEKPVAVKRVATQRKRKRKPRAKVASNV